MAARVAPEESEPYRPAASNFRDCEGQMLEDLDILFDRLGWLGWSRNAKSVSKKKIPDLSEFSAMRRNIENKLFGRNFQSIPLHLKRIRTEENARKARKYVTLLEKSVHIPILQEITKAHLREAADLYWSYAYLPEKKSSRKHDLGREFLRELVKNLYYYLADRLSANIKSRPYDDHRAKVPNFLCCMIKELLPNPEIVSVESVKSLLHRAL